MEMGTTGGRAGSQTTCSGILGERGSAVKGLNAVQCRLRGGNTEEKEMIEEERISVGDELKCE